MYLALSTQAAPVFVYTTIASSAQDGALVSGITGVDAAAIATVDPAGLTQYVNSQLLAAEASLPEYTRVEMDIVGWQTPLGSSAQFVANQINSAFASGQITDPITGGPPESWAEYPGQIAWGDDATDSVTIRVLKAQPPVIALYIIVGLAAVIAVALIWGALQRSSWQAKSATTGVNGAKVFTSIAGFVVDNWWWEVPLAGAAIVAPFVIGKTAQTEEAVNRLRYAERGGF